MSAIPNWSAPEGEGGAAAKPAASTPAAERSSAGLSARLLLTLLGLGVLAGALCLGWQNARDLRLRADITTPDSVLAQAAIWARQSGHLYRSFAAPPYTPTPYGPFYYFVLIGLSFLTGAHLWPLLQAGRAFTLACFFALAGVAYLFGRRVGLSRGLAALGAGFLLSEMDFAHWSLTTRPDVPALLCAFAAVYVAAGLRGAGRGGIEAEGAERDGGGRGLGRAAACGLLMGAALLFKQSYVAAPLAVSLWLLARRRGRELAVTAFAAAAMGAAVLGVLAWRGDAVWSNLFSLRAAMPSGKTALGIVGRSLENYAPHALLLALALVAIGAALTLGKGDRMAGSRRRRGGQAGAGISGRRGRAAPGPASGDGRAGPGGIPPAALPLLALYAVLAWVTGVGALMANSGGGNNYLLEGWACVAVLAAVGVERLLCGWRATPGAARALLLAWVALSYAAATTTWHHQVFTEKPKGEAALARAVRGRSVLSDVPFLALAGRDPEYLDPYLLRTLELRGRWSSRRLVASLDARRYDVLLLDDGTGRVNTVWRGLSHYDAATMRAIAANYQPWCRAFPVVAYLPRGAAAAASEVARGLAAAHCAPLDAVKVSPAKP